MQHWSRRTLFALLHSPWGEIELENVYITPANHYEPGANGGHQLYPYLKLDLLAGLYRALATLVDSPRLLCGDFNAPQHQPANAKHITSAHLQRPPHHTLKH